MSTGFSLLLIAAGAVLAFAVDYQVQGVDLQSIGWILLVVGIVGLAFSMLFLASFAPFGVRETYVQRSSERHEHTGTHDHA